MAADLERKRTRSNSSKEQSGDDIPNVKKEKKDVETTDGLVDKVAILDAGAQYGKVIDRRIRELNVKADLLPLNAPLQELIAEGYKAVIISGSPESVVLSADLSCDGQIFLYNMPILGICYGMQLMNRHLGGKVSQGQLREDGQFSISLDTSCELFKELTEKQDVLLTHGDSVTINDVANQLETVARSGNLVAAVAHKSKPFYGVQFHPETDLTTNGKKMLKNFLFNIANIQPSFTLTKRLDCCLHNIKEAVGDNRVLVLVSGGVDSTLCAALMYKALDTDQILPLHVDTGFMRKNESKQVKESLKLIGMDLKVINAQVAFMNGQTVVVGRDGQEYMTKPLKAATYSEHKRNIIGDTFIKVVTEEVPELMEIDGNILLVQGTLRPDLIESASSMASSHANMIKTHHNDTKLVRYMRDQGRVIEPLKDFHKDEVREIGVDLGLPEQFLKRHPFPGPGLAIRIICADNPFMVEDWTDINMKLKLLVSFHELMEHTTPIAKSLLSSISSPAERVFLMELSQQFSLHACLLPIRTVGVQGDRRSFSHPAVISGSVRPPWTDLIKLAKIIPKVLHCVNRVTWVFGDPVEGPIEEVTPTFLTATPLGKLREVDYLTNEILRESGTMDSISQMPIVLIPIHFDHRPLTPSCQHSVVLRPFITADFMTGLPAVPGKDIPVEVVSKLEVLISACSGISRVLYDLTGKPPGTTEWE